MTNSPNARSGLAHAALGLVHPLIRRTLLEESDFREEYDLMTDAVLSFGETEVSFPRFELFEAARKILGGATEESVADEDGRKWNLSKFVEEEKLPRFVLRRETQRIILPDFSSLSPDSAMRLRSLDEAAADVNLPNVARDEWCSVLEERSLEEDEVDVFHSELRDTPIEQARSIRSEMIEGRSSIRSLVPSSRRYYERLVGEYDGSTSIHDYAGGSGKKLFDQLLAWRPYDGFLFCLFLSSHPAMTDEIDIDQLCREDLVRAFDFLDKHGDRTSQMGAIEIGLRILPSRPEIEPALIRLIEQIRGDDADGQTSGFRLLSALFLLVDGELSRTRLMSAEPPFYRRLAALSQAALIQRQFMDLAMSVDSFCEWAFSNRGEQFFLQSLVDLRLEPHWNPGLVAASQMKAGFFGRIIIAARNNEQSIKGGKLYEFILGTESGSLHSLSHFFDSYLPGPLEGTEESRGILPAGIVEAIETQLSGEAVGPTSFIALVNSALIFRVGADQADLAVRALKLGSHHLANVEDRAQLLAILNGLATVAGVARSRSLADELRILVRRYKRDAQYSLSTEEAVRICLVASASRAGMNEWREFAGEWLTELALGDLEGDAGVGFHSHLRCLCNAVPELWVSCGKADAALMAYNAIRHPG